MKPIERTVVIFDNGIDCCIKFAVQDGDLSKYHGAYININDAGDELRDLIFNADGEFLWKFLDVFPVDEVRNGAIVIVAGVSEY